MTAVGVSELFPVIEPHESGLLEVAHGSSLYWESCGNPRGKPALVVHGGPGIGYRGVSRFFPEAWQTFREGAPEAGPRELVAAYARRMESLETRGEGAQRWANWEDAVVSLEPNAVSRVYGDRASSDLIAFVRICSHYFANAAGLEDGELLQNAGQLRAIPGAILHGRLDLSCPIAAAWELSRAWPMAEFHAIADMGHRANASPRVLMLRAHAQFAQRSAT